MTLREGSDYFRNGTPMNFLIERRLDVTAVHRIHRAEELGNKKGSNTKSVLAYFYGRPLPSTRLFFVPIHLRPAVLLHPLLLSGYASLLLSRIIINDRSYEEGAATQARFFPAVENNYEFENVCY